MMCSHRTIARITLEFTAPFLIGSGERHESVDLVPVCDRNGLPWIPGTSLAGVLRHAFRTEAGSAAECSLFGSLQGASGLSEGSRLTVTGGHLHDATDVPVEADRVRDLAADSVIASAMTAATRDRVRIGIYGSVEGMGKFDEQVVPAGHRFTADLVLDHAGKASEEFERLLALLASGDLRLGRGGRGGRGSFRVVKVLKRSFHLYDAADLLALAKTPVRLDQPLPGFMPVEAKARTAGLSRDLHLQLELKPEAGFSVDGPELWPEFENAHEIRENSLLPDRQPMLEDRVVWRENRGEVRRGVVVPATGIKGALRHRFAWHANALAERFAEEASPEDWVRWSALDVQEVTELFGAMKASAGGSAGRLYLEDLCLGEPGSSEISTKLLAHTSIDRLTGGVRHQSLFHEQVLMGTPFPPLHLRVERWSELSEVTREAFRRALNDLVRGRLSLGAHAARGHGFVRWTGQMPFQSHWESANRRVEEARA